MDVERAAQRVFDLLDAGRVQQAAGVLEEARQRERHGKHDNNSNNSSTHASLDVAAAWLLEQQDKLPQARTLAEALSERDDVHDPRSIDVLVRVLQAVCSWRALARVYERLRTTQPQPRKVDENLVQTYVRMGDYATVQRAAMTLMRSYGDVKYIMWVAQACLAQVECNVAAVAGANDDNSNKTNSSTTATPTAADADLHSLQLRLACKMLESVVLPRDASTAATATMTRASNGCSVATAPATLRTYVQVLQQQHRYDDAVRLLCSARGVYVGVCEQRLELLATVLLQQHRHEVQQQQQQMQQTQRGADDGDGAQTSAAADAANAVARLLWTRQPDNWTAFTLYRDTLSPTRSTRTSADGGGSDEEEDAAGASGVRGDEEHVLELVLLPAGATPAADDGGNSKDRNNDSNSDVNASHVRVRWRRGGADDAHAALVLARHLQQQQTPSSSGRRLRGPFLAELTLLQQQLRQQAHAQASSHSKDSNNKEGDEEALSCAVLRYAQRFYMKPCCYLDLSTFLSDSTPSSSSSSAAARVYAWSCEADDASPGSSSSSSGSDDAAAQLAYHTRRILGLRCLVASWGCGDDDEGGAAADAKQDARSSHGADTMTTAAPLPSYSEVRALIQTCMQLYKTAAPLSASLVWSEEGLCDGYVSVAVNAALRASVACASHDKATTKDENADDEADWRVWLVQTLELLHRDTTRTSNNPSWLIHSVCAAACVGLVDAAVLRQLDLKSIQHDTMSPVAYWPLRRGMLLDELCAHDTRAWTQYYRHVDRDVALLRAKVFAFVSWPAMRSVCAFEQCQRHSLVRVWTYAHGVVNGLLECQTQRSIAEYTRSVAPQLWDVTCALHDSVQRGVLVDNTDWSTLRSVVLGDVHSAVVARLTRAMTAAMPSVTQRTVACRQLLHTLLLVCDVVAIGEHHRQRRGTATTAAAASASASASSRRGGGNTKASSTTTKTTTAPTPSLPRLYCPALLRAYDTAGDVVDFTPAVATVARALLAHVLAHDADSRDRDVAAYGEADEAARVTYTDALAIHLSTLLQHTATTRDGQPLCACTCGDAFERFVYPEAYVLASLLRGGAASVLPLTQWAADVQHVLHEARARYTDATWCALRLPGVVPGGYVHTLLADKRRRMLRYLSDMLVDVKALCARSSQR